MIWRLLETGFTFLVLGERFYVRRNVSEPLRVRLLLSYVDVDEADLRAQAATYGLEDEIDALLGYLETHGEVDDDRLPAWDEFQALAADYEVRLS